MAVDLQQFSFDDVAKKNGKDGNATWIVIKDIVYDVTNYIGEHPGGGDLIEEVAGTDATKSFNDVGHSSDALTILKKLKIGQIIESERKYDKKKKTTAENGDVNNESFLSKILCGLC